MLTRSGSTRKLEGQWIGKRWGGIGIVLPDDVDPADVSEIVHNLEVGIAGLGYGYVISRIVSWDAVPDSEQQAALGELDQMGFEVERSADLKQTTTTWKPGARRPDNAKAAKEFARRMQRAIESLRPSRPRAELLAKSKEFADDYEDHIPH